MVLDIEAGYKTEELNSLLGTLEMRKTRVLRQLCGALGHGVRVRKKITMGTERSVSIQGPGKGIQALMEGMVGTD